MSIEPLRLLSLGANLLIGVAMLSITAALFYGWFRKGRRLSPYLIVFSLFFLCSGIGRVVKGCLTVVPLPAPELLLDLAAGFFGIIASAMVWPIAIKAVKLPTYRDLQDAIATRNQVLNKLNYQHQLFDTFMSNIPVAAAIRNARGQFTYVNSEFERLTGLSLEQLKRPFQGLFHWIPRHIIDREVEFDQDVLRTGKAREDIVFMPLPDGEYRRWLIVRFPWSDYKGEQFIGSVAVDLTSEAEQEKMRAQLAAVVESSDDAIFSKTIDGIITSWNTGAEKLYGYKASEIIGQSVSILAPPDRQQEIDGMLETIKNGEHVRDFETIRLCKDGTILNVEVTCSPIRGPSTEVVGAAVVVRDISAKREAEQKIKQLYEDLQERVQQLGDANVALQTARDQALEASNLKSAFVANISHELRTPLSGIIGMNELLLDREHDTESRVLLQMMYDSAKALLAVVNDILDLSKIEAGKVTLEYEPFDPTFLVKDCVSLLSAAASSKGISLEVTLDKDVPQFVYGDAMRVRQILINLIGNAVKFTAEGGVTVRAEVDRQDSKTAIITFIVTDTGIGIDKEEQRLLFMPFTQVDNSSTRRFGGTGLGLTISKRFVDMMRGEIGFESQKGQGSTFWFKVHFDKTPMGAPEKYPASNLTRSAIDPIAPALAAGRCVLVVEDNPVLRELALRQLVALGVKAQAVETGNDAIVKGGTGEFDVILMDVNLPDLSGNDATRAIRLIEDSSKRARATIIAMTAGAMKGDKEAALESGMDDYLAKPVRVEQLKIILEKWLQARQKQQEQRDGIYNRIQSPNTSPNTCFMPD